MANNEVVAAFCRDMALPKTLDLVVGVLNWSLSHYCARFERLLDASWFAGMFSGGRSKTMVDRSRMRHDTDNGA